MSGPRAAAEGSTRLAVPAGDIPTGTSLPSPPPSVTVKVGYQADLHGAGVLDVGLAQHFWKRFGVNVEMVQFSNGPTEVQAMAGGDIQFGYLGPGAVWIPASGRATIITVDSLEVGDSVIGQPNITSLADLRGKRVGYAPGTSGEMILRLALQRAGLALSDIQPVTLDATAVVPAFLSGHIDAAATWVPLTEAIGTTEPNAHLLINDTAFSAQYNFPDVWVASTAEATSRPDIVKRFLEGFALANDYRLSHTAQAIALVSSQAGVPAAGLSAQNKATVWIPSRTLAKDYTDGTAHPVDRRARAAPLYHWKAAPLGPGVPVYLLRPVPTGAGSGRLLATGECLPAAESCQGPRRTLVTTKQRADLETTAAGLTARGSSQRSKAHAPRPTRPPNRRRLPQPRARHTIARRLPRRGL